MTKISLRAYNREIEGLIEHDQQTDEAIAHCRQILKTFPKHLETYRLLGKAYLEAKRQREAIDIFERVLLAAPEDFVSHVGMSIIADEQGGLDDAIWHMERAFEVQPSNAAIQGELQRLFGRRDGAEPPKIRLTRGALARMYMQGELYSQAIAEIKAVLGADPKRTDMQTLLAKAYYLNGQKNEAASISTELLSRQPYCLDADRLMAEILSAAQKTEAAQDYRQRVIELDPYAAFVSDSLFRSDNVADGAVNLERLEYTGPLAGQAPVLALGTGAQVASAAHAPTEPDWLSSGGPPQLPPGPSVGAGSEAATELPDFLKQAGWSRGTTAALGDLNAAADEVPAEPAAVPADLPQWVQAFAPAEAASDEPQEDESAPVETPDWLAELGSSPAKEAAASPPAFEAGAQVPEWLRDLGGREIDEPAAIPRTPPEEEIAAAPTAATEALADETPSWLKDFAGDLDTPLGNTPSKMSEPGIQEAAVPPGPSIGSLGTTEQEQDDAMSWLEGLAAKHGAKPEELVTDPKSRQQGAPEWVDRARQIGEGAEPDAKSAQPDFSEVPGSSDLDLTGKWLTSLQADASLENDQTGGAEPSDKGEVVDWISRLTEQGDLMKSPTEQKNEGQQEAEPEDNAPWLDESTPAPIGEPSVDEAPAWLGRAAAKPEPREAAAGSAPAASAQIDLPEWLAGLDEESSESETTGEAQDDVPPWLRPEVESEPKAAEPTRPADWRPAETTVTTPSEPEGSVGTEAQFVPASPSEEMAAPDVEDEAPIIAPKPRVTPVPLKTAAGAQTSLEGAQAELGRGNIAAALDGYGRLIRKGKSLEEIIRDLRDALYRYPVEIPIWQALGDAYMRANRLQEALDAYTKAEELLR